jgi:threonine-phosphate decarboxylase
LKSKHGGNIYQISRQLGFKPDQVLDFSANINPLGFSPRIKKVFSIPDRAIHHYPDHEAYDLVCELAKFHHVPRENILAGNGSTEFIFLLPRLIRPNRVLLVVPTFSEYEASLKMVKAKILYFRTLEEEKFCILEKQLLEEMKRGYDALYICNPGNPTGILTRAAMLKRLVAAARQYGTKIIIDETFIDFHEDQSLKQETRRYENLYILRSMTKFFGIPGLRAGYIFSHIDNINNLKKVREPWTMNALAQLASIESLRDTIFIKKTIRYVENARHNFVSELKTIPFLEIIDGKANYLLLKLSQNSFISVSELFARLLQKGIIIRQCENFYGLDHRFFRVAVRKKNENKKLVAELRTILGMHKTLATSF